MAVATGIPPPALLDLDDPWLDALSAAAARRWGMVEELLATVAELLHAQLAAFVKVHAKDPPRMSPLRIPRPGDDRAPVAASAAEIVGFFRGRGVTCG